MTILDFHSMRFQDIAGHNQLKTQLIELVKAERIPHAMMLNGSVGTGGFAMAHAFAQYINCTSRTAEDSCGECHSCVNMTTLTHPDLSLSFPIFNRKIAVDKDSINSEVKKKSEEKSVCASFIKEFRNYILENPYGTVRAWFDSLDASSKQANIPKAECIEIVKKMSLKSFMGGYKILIIWHPEYLKKEGNALLKLIEEPPGKSLFLFVTEDIDKILGTIQSRTQLFKLNPLSAQNIEEYLMNKGVPNDQAKIFSFMAEGNMQKALSLSQDGDSNYFEHLRAWMNGLFTNNAQSIIQWVSNSESMSKEGLKNFLLYTTQLFEHSIRMMWMTKEEIHLPLNERNFIDKLIKNGIDAEEIEQINLLLSEAIYHIERNVNVRTMLSAVSMNMQEILLKKKLTSSRN